MRGVRYRRDPCLSTTCRYVVFAAVAATVPGAAPEGGGGLGANKPSKPEEPALRWCDEWTHQLRGTSHCVCRSGFRKARDHQLAARLPEDSRWGWTCVRMPQTPECEIDRWCHSCKGLAWSPVCGVDGRTYSTSCRAKCRCVELASEGECPEHNSPPNKAGQRTQHTVASVNALEVNAHEVPDHPLAQAALSISATVTQTDDKGVVTVTHHPAPVERGQGRRRRQGRRGKTDGGTLHNDESPFSPAVTENGSAYRPRNAQHQDDEQHNVPTPKGEGGPPETKAEPRIPVDIVLDNDDTGDIIPTHLSEWSEEEDDDVIPEHLQEWSDEETTDEDSTHTDDPVVLSDAEAEAVAERELAKHEDIMIKAAMRRSAVSAEEEEEEGATDRGNVASCTMGDGNSDDVNCDNAEQVSYRQGTRTYDVGGNSAYSVDSKYASGTESSFRITTQSTEEYLKDDL
jgi:hypothetical protein